MRLKIIKYALHFQKEVSYVDMNGIIACELIIAVVWMGLMFTSFANTELIADQSSKSEGETKTDRFGRVKQPDLSPRGHEDCSRRLLGEKHRCGSVPSGK